LEIEKKKEKKKKKKERRRMRKKEEWRLNLLPPFEIIIFSKLILPVWTSAFEFGLNNF
jgi:hypothetical protein